MSMLGRLAEVRRARFEVERQRRRLRAPAQDLAERAAAHPAWWLGGAALGGFLLGRSAVRVWRIPGLLGLLSGEAMAWLGQLADVFDPATDFGDEPPA